MWGSGRRTWGSWVLGCHTIVELFCTPRTEECGNVCIYSLAPDLSLSCSVCLDLWSSGSGRKQGRLVFLGCP